MSQICCSVLQCHQIKLHTRWRLLQCVAVCCSVLQCVAVCCSVLQCHQIKLHTRWRCNTLQQQSSDDTATHCNTLQHTATHCNTLQQVCDMICRKCDNMYPCVTNTCVAVCCSVLQCHQIKLHIRQAMPLVCCSVLQCVAVCCSVLQHVAVCCSVIESSYTYDFMPPLGYMRQGGEDAEDAWNCRSLSAKEPLILGLFCGK